MSKLIALVVVILLAAGIIISQRREGNANAVPTGSIPAPTAAAAGDTPGSAGTVVADNIYLWKNGPKNGTYLTDFQGKTLYTYDKDPAGKSNCNAACAVLWPAYSSGATAQSSFPAGISVILRDDNQKQFAWEGKPLYYYSGDKTVGDIKGDNFGKVWHIVHPAGLTVSPAPTK